jgi:hypothetical protein
MAGVILKKTGEKLSYTVLVLGFLLSFFLLSPLSIDCGLRGRVVFSIMIFSIVICIARKRLVNINLLSLFSFSLFLTSLTAIYWGLFSAYWWTLFIFLSFIFSELMSCYEIESLINLLTKALLILLAGCWTAFIVYMEGGSSVGSFITSTGRELLIYPFSFSEIHLSSVGPHLRPSAIFDEPGTLSFAICLVAAFRDLYSKNKITTLCMLLLGLITLSVVHVIFLVLYICVNYKFILNKKLFYFVITLIIIIFFYADIMEVINASLIDRFKPSESEAAIFKGDNRTFRFINAFQIIINENFLSLLFGVDGGLIDGSTKWLEENSEYGQNPLDPIITTGLLISWPYYFFMGLILYLGVTNIQYRILLPIFLVYCQRPYIYSAGYAFFSALLLTIIIRGRRWKSKSRL